MWIYSLVLINLVVLIWYIRLFLLYRAAWNAIPEAPPHVAAVTDVSLSVVIAVRNEENTLEHLFRYLDKQKTNARLEFVLVNDHSTDRSMDLMTQWADQHGHVSCLSLVERNGKKAAIEAGIQAARGTYILCTDADTQAGPEWADTMLKAAMANEAVFVSGPVAIQAGSSWFSRWQALEFSGLIAIGGAAIFQQRPNMCNGANLLFLREAFFEVNGYEGNAAIASGDDQFLMHKMAERFPGGIVFCKNQKAIVQTLAMGSLREFVNQRVRWASKNGQFIRKSVSYEMIGIWFLSLLILGETVLGFWLHSVWLLALGTFLGKMLVELFFYRSVARFFGISSLLRQFWFAELVQVVYVFGIGCLAKFVSFEWKGRKHE